MSMERQYLSVYFPNWSIDVTKRKIQKSGSELEASGIFLTSVQSQQLVIRRACPAGMTAGVRDGMALPLALAMLPGAYIEPFDPVRDFKALHRLAAWCFRFSPLVGLDFELLQAARAKTLDTIERAHYGITIDLTGTDRLHGGTPALARHIYELFEGRARIALAPTVGSAWALSRYGSIDAAVVVSSKSELADAIGPLPMRALRVGHETVEQLADVGIRKLEALMALPRLALSKRFGKLLSYRLDQCFGIIEERLNIIDVPHVFQSLRTFEPPLTNRKNIVFAIKLLFKNVIGKLKLKKKKAKYFLLSIHEADGREISKEFSLAVSSDDEKHLASVIEPIVDGMNFFGEVAQITVCARNIEDSKQEQHGLSPTSSLDTQQSDREHEHARNELLNNFSIRIGKDRISIAKLHQSYIPERSFSYESVINQNNAMVSGEETPAYGIHERPPLLYRKPEQIFTIAMLPDKPPSMIHWQGKKLRILSGFGPERIAPEWWHGDLQRDEFSERDYFKIQDEHGRWLWVYRDKLSLTWFLHGVWS